MNHFKILLTLQIQHRNFLIKISPSKNKKVFVENVKGVDEKVGGKVKSSKSNKEDTIKEGDQLKGGESENMTELVECRFCSFKGKTKISLEKHVDSEHESNLTCDVCGKMVYHQKL